MNRRSIARYFIAAVWLINGLWAKVLGGVPRHEQIVAEILGAEVAPVLVVLIGIAEIGMAAWVLVGWFPRLCAGFQIAVVLSMNVLEVLLARELLLFGEINVLIAVAFCALVYVHGFVDRV